MAMKSFVASTNSLLSGLDTLVGYPNNTHTHTNWNSNIAHSLLQFLVSPSIYCTVEDPYKLFSFKAAHIS